MRCSLFEGLPPPSSIPRSTQLPPPVPTTSAVAASKGRPDSTGAASSILPPATATKRVRGKADGDAAKRVRFKSNEVQASETQVLAAMGKIASHIGNPGKFSKASKLAMQLLQANSVNCNTVDAFFEILRAAMTSPSQAIDVKLWADYHALFTAVFERLELFSATQKAQIEVWQLWAILANEFRTDDTFVFSKAAARVRQSLDSLPDANEEDELLLKETEKDIQELSVLEESNENGAPSTELRTDSDLGGNCPSNASTVDSDPFGLTALMPILSNKEERVRRKRVDEAASLQAHKDAVKLLNEHRGAIISCLKIAADKYRFQWAQTIIDMLVKYAYDALPKFTVSQKHTVEHVWGSIREQLLCRKHNKAASGKYDITPFERLQSLYAREHISIRRAVGLSGERSAEQWLG